MVSDAGSPVSPHSWIIVNQYNKTNYPNITEWNCKRCNVAITTIGVHAPKDTITYCGLSRKI